MDRDSADLTCQEVAELVTEYLSHAMTAEDRARFEQHLLDCLSCIAYLDQMKATIELIGRLGDEPSGGEPPKTLIARLRRRAKS